MREPVALGYLLARLTDTVADAPGIPRERRLEVLDDVAGAVAENRGRFDEPVDDIGAALTHPGERALVGRVDDLLAWLASLDESNRGHLAEVIGVIAAGQRWDVEAFTPTRPAPCETGEDLLDYTYRVAGCVGEFWTRVGFTNLGERFAATDREAAMLAGGRRLGQGLQLVNVLRDLHEDLPRGRCYLPADELRAAGWDGEGAPTVDPLRPAFRRWLDVCRECLAEQDAYVREIRNRRVRASTRLPMRLAERTADRLEQAGVERVMREKIKVSRRAVWGELGRALVR